MVTPAQLRGARAMLGWSRQQLADKAGVSNRTLERFETGEADLKLKMAGNLRRTLEKAGVTFVDPTAEHGPGVILKDGKLK